MKTNRPPFVIAGAQKSCSTSLAHTLRMHPEIEMPKREFLGFDGRGWEASHRRIVRRTARAGKRGLVFGFKRPEVFHEPDIAARAARALPNGSAVVVLRDPAERMVSAYFHYADLGVLRINRNPEEHLYAMLTTADDGLSPVERMILRYSAYARSFDVLEEAFEGRVLVIFQDDLLTQTAIAMETIQEFIGVAPDPSLHLGAQNTGHYPQRSNLAGRLFGIATFRIETDSERMIPRPLIVRTLGRPLAQFRPGIRASTTKPILSDRLREVAQARFSADLALLEARLGRVVPRSWTVRRAPT